MTDDNTTCTASASHICGKFSICLYFIRFIVRMRVPCSPQTPNQNRKSTQNKQNSTDTHHNNECNRNTETSKTQISRGKKNFFSLQTYTQQETINIAMEMVLLILSIVSSESLRCGK